MDTSSFPVPPAAVAVPVLALITFILDIPPLVWHIRNRNLAASSLVFWIILSNVMNFINALIWPRDNIEQWWHGEVLCDIEVKIMVAIYVSGISSLLCIMRNLAAVLDTERAVLSLSKAERRKQAAIDCFFCFGLPLYMVAIHYVVQPNRYYIFAISGCTASFDNSWPKLVLVFIWPPILCLANIYYSVLIIIRMRRYRRNFSDILASSDSGLTRRRFLRLFLMALILIVIVTPVQMFLLYKNSAVQLIPYSWDLVHESEAWQEIMLIPTEGTVNFDRWIQLAIGFVVFFFFGMGPDAMAMYRQGLLKLGLGRFFTCLRQENRSRRPSYTSSGQASSIGSRARLVAKKTWKRMSNLSRIRNKPCPSTASSNSHTLDESAVYVASQEGQGPRSNSTAPSSPVSLKKLEKSNLYRSEPSWLAALLIRTHIAARSRTESVEWQNPDPRFDVEKNAGEGPSR